MRNLPIPPSFHLQTLSSFLQSRFPKGYVQKLFLKKGVRVNGERGKKDTLLHSGDMLTFYVPLLPKKETSLQWKPDILFEDDHIAVIHKKAGIAVHEGKTVSYKDSLIGHLTAYYKSQDIVPHLVHRLDKDTSGCLLMIKDKTLVSSFEQMFESGQVDKTYKALVKGILPQITGKIDTPLPGRDGHLVHALSTFTVDRVYHEAGVSLVTVKIETGRMHQIRLHFAKIGHPVVMDEEHGDFAFNKVFRKTYKLKRQFLHAETLSFVYQQEHRTFTAPLPEDLSAVLSKLS
jgi:23S rRNA pseudouridine955/2504/2580 synthase